jgi:glyoxylase-like metal-dependent hydrolase (beta-lactamase superfamily II)
MVEVLAAAGVGPGEPLSERTIMELTFGRNLYDLVPEDDVGREFFRWRFAAGGLAGARLRLPTLAVEGECTFHLGDRRMVLRHLGPGHTDGDLVVWFPEDSVVFVADLLFHGRFPWLGDSNVPAWIARLDDVEALGARTVVPGHGEPVTTTEVLAFRDLLRALVDETRAAAGRGLDEAAAVEAVRLPAFAHLPRYKEWLPIAVRKLYREAKRGGSL